MLGLLCVTATAAWQSSHLLKGKTDGRQSCAHIVIRPEIPTIRHRCFVFFIDKSNLRWFFYFGYPQILVQKFRHPLHSPPLPKAFGALIAQIHARNEMLMVGSNVACLSFDRIAVVNVGMLEKARIQARPFFPKIVNQLRKPIQPALAPFVYWMGIGVRIAHGAKNGRFEDDCD